MMLYDYSRHRGFVNFNFPFYPISPEMNRVVLVDKANRI
jgi:hypothetical protein